MAASVNGMTWEKSSNGVWRSNSARLGPVSVQYGRSTKAWYLQTDPWHGLGTTLGQYPSKLEAMKAAV